MDEDARPIGMRMAHDEHEGFGPLHDGWPMLHAVCMRDALTLMRMAHMKRMRDGHKIAWVNGDRHLQGIFGGDGDGWGWDGDVWPPNLACVGR